MNAKRERKRERERKEKVGGEEGKEGRGGENIPSFSGRKFVIAVLLASS